MNSRVRGYIGIAYLALCLMLGGASAAGALGNALLQLLALIIILILIWSGKLRLPPEARPLAWIVGLFLAVGALSLIPLPAGLWQSLPGRGNVAAGLRLLGVGEVGLPLSLAPAATVASLLWLLPPVAMFLLAVTLAWDERRRLYGTVLVVAVLSIMLGVFQLLGGPQSSLRFYEITNEGSPVGFFSNINHQATLLLCAIPCAAVFAIQFATGADRSKRSGGMIMASAFALFLTAGIALSGSIAGYGLFLPAAFAALLNYRRATAGALGAAWKAALAALLIVAAGFALFGPGPPQALSDKYSTSPASRRAFAANTAEAIVQTAPVGTGLGSFSGVYRRFEDPRGATGQFVNHAHNDYLELVLELGVPGALLIAAFLFWWLRRSLYAWRSDLRGANLARAASVIVGIVLMHSIVDYPLRTSAMAAVFAVACAFLVPYMPTARRRRKADAEADEAGAGARHLEAV
ncbi:MAG TPA: O-antigen ligase family protein [Allosphingosinicella sp.]|jgi:O-antigen ligase